MGGAGKVRRGSLAAIVAAALVAVAPAPAAASTRPGALDRGFGANGRVVTQTPLGGPGWQDAHVHIAEGPNGTIVAAAGRTVFRYLPDGSLDPSFADGGKLTIEDPAGLPFTLSDIDVDRDGRLVVFGEVEVPGVRLQATYFGLTIPLTQAAILRYDRNGVLDPSFGGDGSIVTDFGQPDRRPAPDEPHGAWYGKAVAGIASGYVDEFGGLTVLGTTAATEGCIRGSLQVAPRLVARFTPSGDLDPSFGGSGTVSDTGLAEIRGLAASPGGGEMLAGPSIARRLCKGSPPGEAPVPELVSRLAPDGSIDTSFATGGFRPLPLTSPVRSMAVDDSGRLDLRAGSIISAGGIALNSLSPWNHGRMFLVGAHIVPRTHAASPTSYFPQSFALTRRAPSGNPDRRFGHNGWVTTRFGRRSGVLGQEAFIDGNGRLVVAGPIARPDLSPTGGIALARYRLRR